MKINTRSEFTANQTTNYEGGQHFKTSAPFELYQRVAGCLFGEPKFYETGEENTVLLLNLVELNLKEDPFFVLDLAVYARRVLNLRTVPIVLLCEAALKSIKVREYVPLIIQRVDDMTECIAYIQSKLGSIGDARKTGSLPSSLKRGLADSFVKFDAYQFSKYKGSKGDAVKLRDVIRLTHPKPRNDAQSFLYKSIIDDTLAPPETWEYNIMTQGSSKESWEKIIPNMPIMATLRNLRNFLDKQVGEEALKTVIARLNNPEIIHKSRLFPFRFLTAYNQLASHASKNATRIMEALETAMDLSIANIPHLQGETAIFADNSGSMNTAVSSKSEATCKDIANIMASIGYQINQNAIVGTFATNFARVNFTKRMGTIAGAKMIGNIHVGGSTEAHLCLRYLLDNKLKVDRIMIFTDGQCYSSYGASELYDMIKRYRHTINSKMYYYEINLIGYGGATAPQDDAQSCLIAGWSERIFDFIPIFESARNQDLLLNIAEYVSNVKAKGLIKDKPKEDETAV